MLMPLISYILDLIIAVRLWIWLQAAFLERMIIFLLRKKPWTSNWMYRWNWLVTLITYIMFETTTLQIKNSEKPAFTVQDRLSVINVVKMKLSQFHCPWILFNRICKMAFAKLLLLPPWAPELLPTNIIRQFTPRTEFIHHFVVVLAPKFGPSYVSFVYKLYNLKCRIIFTRVCHDFHSSKRVI